MNQVQNYAVGAIQAFPVYFNQINDAISRFTYYSGASTFVFAISKMALEWICPYPDICVKPNECIEKRKTALVDLAHPPEDWNEAVETICRKENEGALLCDPEIHQEGVCKFGYRTIHIVDQGIEWCKESWKQVVNFSNLEQELAQLAEWVEEYRRQLMSVRNLENTLGAVTQIVQFLCNRILHRV